MKQLTTKELYSMLAALYWKAHTDGQLAASFGTNHGLAAVTIANHATKFYPSKDTAAVMKRISKLNK